MDVQPVLDAYSSMSARYVALFDGDWQPHEDEASLIRDHLTGLPGPVFDAGSARPGALPGRHPRLVLHDPPVAGGLGSGAGQLHRLLASSGMLVIGFFDSDDDVVAFDHAVVTAYRWPVDAFAERLVTAGFTEVQRLQQQFAERPDRRYAAIAACAS